LTSFHETSNEQHASGDLSAFKFPGMKNCSMLVMQTSEVSMPFSTWVWRFVW